MRLAPGATHQVQLTVEVLDSSAGVQAVQAEIAAIQGEPSVEVHREPLTRLPG